MIQHEKAEVTDLFGDFCNGKSLLAVLEILSGTHLVCIVLTSSQLTSYNSVTQLHFKSKRMLSVL